MAELNFTPEQRAAIDTRGSTVLVSAAAGSGKTRVLTERLMAYLTDAENPVDIDRFLVITYTRAAAAELRSRILDGIYARIASDPENRRLRRQAALCARAEIGTIHSFCADFLRANCAALALAPDFQVADTERCIALRTTALEHTLERAYARMDADAGFRLLADTVGGGRDDARLGELVLTLYDKMQCHARPEQWAAQQVELLALDGVTDAGATPWGRALLARMQESAEHWCGVLEAQLDIMADEDMEWLMDIYGDSFSATADGLRALAYACNRSWDAAVTALQDVPFPRLGSTRKPPDPDVRDRVKAQRDAAKKAIQTLQKQINIPSAQALADLHTTAPAMQALLALTLNFGAAYAAEKRRRSLVDFSDLEHMTAQLLTDEDGAPTELARQLSGRYTEIMVDEYQDVSEVQDLIFRAVSRGGSNLFFVGDVKQSIYRFRLANPTIFLDKYARFADFREAAPGAPRRILLRENFRSRRAVLEAANHVFSNIMSRALGELDYDDAARLHAGASYPGDDVLPELAVLELPDADDDAPTPEKSALEADYVAQRIRALIDGGASVWENGAARPAHYGDVVILLRSANSIGPVYRAALTAQGIPVSSETSGGFYTSEEVSVLRSLLAVIDNPHQDVPLIAVLRSPLFGLTADDLAAVRTCDREHDFYTAVTLAAETRGDCRDFLDVLARYRALSIELPLGDFLWHIIDDRAIMALTSAMPDGELRRRNVLLLLDLAQQFEQTGARGLHRFLLWMQRQETEGVEPAAPGGESRSVRILSIHKSKGLEFPFVFLCDTARLFNKSDARESVLVHPVLGLGPKCTDLEHGVEYPTIARQAIAAQLLTEMLSEEMRLLYVAMTRAKERLVITGTVRDIGKTVSTLTATATVPLAPELLRAAQSPLHWLLQSALLDRDERYLRQNYVYLTTDTAAGSAEAEAEPTLPEPDPALLAQLERTLTFRYAHAQAIDLPSKVTATELKRLEPETAPPEDAGAPLLKGAPRTQVFRRPDFSARERRLTAAERGTATHRTLQYLHFADARTPEGIAAQVQALAARGLLTAREAQAVNTASLLRLMRAPLGAALAAAEAAGTLRREFRFSLLCPAETFFPGTDAEQVLLQGVVDAWFETKDGLVIVDYKTDRIRPDAVPERTAYYAAQLRAYAGAMARITGRPVCRRTLYFLHCGCSADVPETDA